MDRSLVVVTAALLGVLSLFLPLTVFADDASAYAILRAVDEAHSASLCTERVQSYGSDCKKTTVTCGPGNKWKEYVEAHYELTGSTVQGKPGPASEASRTFRALDYLRADWERNRATPPGPVQKGTCYCKCLANDDIDVCRGKVQGTPFRVKEDLTQEQCVARCAPRPVSTEKCSIQPSAAASADGPRSAFSQTDLCFTSAECASQGGVLETDDRCPGKGVCYAAEPVIRLNTPIGPVTHIQGFNAYVVTAYRYLLTIVGVVATVMFVWGAFLYLVGAALPSIQRGRAIMLDAIVGLLLVLGATTILRTINPATTTLDPIKVPMVNTAQFVQTAFCADLPGNPKTAEAGIRPALRPVEEVAKDPDAFSVPAISTRCGVSYWVQNATGAACDGRACANSGEACISCTDGSAPACQGKSSASMVCARTTIAGTIRYANEKVPERVYLMYLCAHAQTDPEPDNPEAIATVMRNMMLDEFKPNTAGFKVAGRVTDTGETGLAGYRFDLDPDVLNLYGTECESLADGNAFRGALIGVEYNDDTVGSSVRGTASALLKVAGVIASVVPPVGGGLYSAGEAVGGYAYDDIAVISKADCGSGRKAFAGYATGIQINNEPDLASAFLCGVKRGRLLDGPNVYWKESDLRAAIDGTSPIICDFTLDSETAPSDPGRVCDVK